MEGAAVGDHTHHRENRGPRLCRGYSGIRRRASGSKQYHSVPVGAHQGGTAYRLRDYRKSGGSRQKRSNRTRPSIQYDDPLYFLHCRNGKGPQYGRQKHGCETAASASHECFGAGCGGRVYRRLRTGRHPSGSPHGRGIAPEYLVSGGKKETCNRGREHA